MSEDNTIAEELNDIATDETEDKKALTRSIHIIALGIEVTVTSQDSQDDLQIIQGIAEGIIDKYTKKSDSAIYR